MRPRSFLRINRPQQDQISKFVILVTAFAVFLNTSALPLLAASRADKKILDQEIVAQVEANKAAEVEVLSPTNQEELEQAEQYAAAELAKATNVAVVSISGADASAESSAAVESIAKKIAPPGTILGKIKLLRTKIVGESDQNPKFGDPKYRVKDPARLLKFWPWYKPTFTLIRGTTNGVTGTMAVMVQTHVPWFQAGWMGLVAGGLSGGLQQYNGPFQTWISKDIELRKFFPKLSKTIAKTASAVIPYMKWGGVELFYLGATAAVGVAAAVPGAGGDGTFTDFILHTLGTAAWACISQAPWDVGLGLQSKTEMLKAAAGDGVMVPVGKNGEPDFDKVEFSGKKIIRFTTDMKTVVVSMVSVGAALLKMVEWQHAPLVLYAIGAAGLINYVRAKIVAIRDAKVCELALAEPPPSSRPSIVEPPSSIDP